MARVYAMDVFFLCCMFVGYFLNVDCVVWYLNCNYVVIGFVDCIVRLWDMFDGECVRVFVGYVVGVCVIVFVFDG